MYVGLHVKYSLFWSDRNETQFSRQIFEKYSVISIFTKIRPLEAELYHADRQTDMTKLIVAFRNFSNAPKDFRSDFFLLFLFFFFLFDKESMLDKCRSMYH
jgi:hypothetical protein